MLSRRQTFRNVTLAAALHILNTSDAMADGGSHLPATSPLWSRENLLAWSVAPFDTKKRNADERAQMLKRLGFKSYAYDWLRNDVPTFDAEIEAFERHGIHIIGWLFPFDADDQLFAADPRVVATLAAFKRHKIHPQLWVLPSLAWYPKTPEQWAKIMPKGFVMPTSEEEALHLSEKEKAEIERVKRRLLLDTVPQNPEEREKRLQREADRIRKLVELVAPYGIDVQLYNDIGWLGIAETQLEIINRLKAMNISNVGMVYNFFHARDELHDDSKNFPELWEKIKSQVVVVNIAGVRWEGQDVYPSQGNGELEMMRAIQKSGWHGPVGVIGHRNGDAEEVLKNALAGLDWLAAELRQSGSGGPRPLPTVP